MALKWERAYYPKDDVDITVSDALEVRRRNAGEYRENPCYNSREDYNEGLGIKLTPVDNSTNYKVDYFRQYGKGEGENGEYNLKIYEKIADDVGLNKSTSNYTKVAMRVKSMINFLANTIANDKIASKLMMIETVEPLDRKNLNLGDVLIHHKPEFHRKTTTIFVKDRGRKPNYKLSDSNIDSISNWIYDIMKIEHDLITNWDKIRPLLMRDWKSFDNYTKRKISSLKEAEMKKKMELEKEKNLAETGIEETDEEREIREKKESQKEIEYEQKLSQEMEKNYQQFGHRLTDDDIKKLNSEYHKKARLILRKWRGLGPSLGKNTLRSWGEENKLLTKHQTEEIEQLEKITQERNFDDWSKSLTQWGIRKGELDRWGVRKKIDQGKLGISVKDFYTLVDQCDRHIESVGLEKAKIEEEKRQKHEEELQNQREKNFEEIGIKLTDSERASHEELEQQKEDNERKYGVRVTNDEIKKSDPFIELSKERLTKIYTYCEDINNDLTPLFQAFLVKNKDLGGIPLEKQTGLFDNLENTQSLINQTMAIVQDLYHSDFWEDLRRDFLISPSVAEKTFQEIYTQIDEYSKIEDNVKNIISYFKIGEVEKITQNGYGFIYRSMRADGNVFFHSSALRGIKFEDIELGLSVLIIVKDSKKGVEAILVFKNFSKETV